MKPGSFFRSAASVASGTAVSQVIVLLATPVLTRLYTPEDFGTLAVYAAALAILVAVSCLRLEIAIPLPKEEAEATSLLVLSIAAVILVTSITSVLLILGFQYGKSLRNTGWILGYFWLVPVGVLFGGIYNALMYWCTRQGYFKLLALSKSFQSVASVTTQISLGLYGAGAWGLLIGYVVNSAAGMYLLARFKSSRERRIFKAIKFSNLVRTFKQYQAFPKYSSFEALSNSAASQLPIIVMAAHLQGSEVGFLMLALRVSQAPLTLVGGAIAQVYLHQASKESSKGALSDLTTSVLHSLAKIGIGPLILAATIAPEMFYYAFGPSWTRAGEMVAWMLPWLVFQFMASPISMVMHVAGSQKKMLVLTLFGLLIRFGTVLVAIYLNEKYVVEAYCISGGVFYLICLLVFARAASLSNRKIFHTFLGSMPWVLPWLVFSIVLNYSLLYV